MKLITLVIFCFCYAVQAQDFEGVVVYEIEALNPNPKIISDSLWNAKIEEEYGSDGKAKQRYFYKNQNYLSVMTGGQKRGYQLYDPENKLIYSWEEGSDTAITVDSRDFIDELIGIKSLDRKDTILGIPTDIVSVKSKFGETIIWYNSNYLKIDPKLYKGHKYGHWYPILEKTKSLPLKIETKSFMTHMVQTAVDYEQKSIEIDKFKLPSFKYVMANPVN